MKNILKKWWFWLIILVLAFVIGFVLIVLLGFNTINPDKNLTRLSMELQEYDNEITVYQSAGKNTIIVECNIQNSDDSIKKSENIGKIIGKYLDYLSVYKDVMLKFSTDDGYKETFSIDVKTKQIKEESVEEWVLKDSDAQRNIQKEISALENKKVDLNTQITSLESKKNDLNTEIQKLNSDVIKIKGKEKTYPAGYLIAGTDFDVGRYKIYGGSSNFIVHSITDDLKVNIILGNSDVKEYIYNFSIGDKVQANSSFKMVLVN